MKERTCFGNRFPNIFIPWNLKINHNLFLFSYGRELIMLVFRDR